MRETLPARLRHARACCDAWIADAHGGNPKPFREDDLQLLTAIVRVLPPDLLDRIEAALSHIRKPMDIDQRRDLLGVLNEVLAQYEHRVLPGGLPGEPAPPEGKHD